jgi:hypothetical protein
MEDKARNPNFRKKHEIQDNPPKANYAFQLNVQTNSI